MYIVVLLLVAVASQMAWGSAIPFSGEVKVDNNGEGVVREPVPAILQRIGNSKETEPQWLMIHSDDGNTTAEITGEISENTQINDTLILSRVGDHLGNKQSNETSLLSFVGDVDPQILNRSNGASNKHIGGKDSEINSMDMENVTEADNNDDYYVKNVIPSVNKRRGKSLRFNSDSTSHLPSEGGADIIYFGDENRKPAGPMIMFPTPRSPVHINPIEGNGNIPNTPVFNPCGKEGYIIYQDACHQVLSSGPCGGDKWLVMKTYDTAQCEPRPCPMGQIFYHDRCVHPEDSSICPMGQMLYVEMTGIAFCDCDSGYFYFPQDGTCISEYEQGWCTWGKYLVRNRDGTPECERNPCGITGSVYHVKSRMCYRKDYVGHCAQEDIVIEGNVAECHEMLTALRNIFEVPTLRRCPKGSLRDILHECRRRFNLPSIPSVLKYRHLYGGCPHGWTKSRRGKCKKIVNLFAGR